MDLRSITRELGGLGMPLLGPQELIDGAIELDSRCFVGALAGCMRRTMPPAADRTLMAG